MRTKLPIFMYDLPLKDMTPDMLLVDILSYFSDASNYEKVRYAALFASYFHRQDRRGPRGPLKNDPYIAHPYRVALRLLRWGFDGTTLICAAILHDVYEDHAGDIQTAFDRPPEVVLRSHFGHDIADLVMDLSNPPDGDYHDHVRTLIKTSRPHLLVKFSDFCDNALSLHHTPGERRGRLARKYLPLAEDFRAALETVGTVDMMLALDKGLPRLADFAKEGA